MSTFIIMLAVQLLGALIGAGLVLGVLWAMGWLK